MGPASDLRQKECPRLLSWPAPLAALHTVISAGAFVFHLPDPKLQSRGHRRAHSNTSQLLPPRCSLQSHLRVQPLQSLSVLVSLQSRSHGALPQSCFFFFFFPSLHHATKMLIALQSQSLKSLTYCVDSIPRLLQPFMWVLMYCHLQAL